ncbi:MULTISPECIES: TIGR02680 family protein [unclassified Kitasatospora]|uniref:TIGR02680 family protein n=1 Tax=unclassified Kitasatospora TaxID=2633591 RepID=UPI00382965A5
MSRQSAPAAPHDHATHRFRLHRAGIRNVWQYDEQEFRFGDGRLLLRGKNGAGKSKALEMLLPYLLDGDARALDATGTGRTTLAWLMLDGFEQTNRMGYLWVEFRRTDDEGTERFLTVGAAVRASKSTGTAKPHFFTTTRRVGEELLLAEAGQPLPLDRLRAAVGAENVLERPADHRARVARDLFGLTDSARYRNLTQLLHRLRRPTIGDRIESGGLVTVLSETLPALDEDVVEKVARNLDDLDSVRDDLGRLEKTDAALRHFLGGYRGYLHGVLRRRAGAVDSELDTLAARRRAAGEAAQLVGGLRAEETAATEIRNQLRTEQEEARADLAALRQSTGYRSLQELGERRRTVEAVRVAAWTAFEMLRVAHEGEHAAGAAVSAGAERVGTGLRRLGESHRELRDAAERSGIGPAHLGEPAAVPPVVLTPAGEEEILDPDGVAHPVGRDRVAAYDTVALAGELRRWDASLAAAEPVAKARMRTVGELAGLLAESRNAAVAARDADVERERLGEQAEQATERAGQRRRAVLAAGDGYAAQVSAWAERLERLAGVPLDDVRAVVARDESSDGSGDGSFADRALPAEVWEDVAQTAERSVNPVLDRLAGERDRTTPRVHNLSLTLDALVREKREWEQRTDPEPPRPAHRGSARSGPTGAPLYRAVDFADGLTAPDQAGLEAALEAGGLLDAWITAEGALLDPLTQDTLLRPGAEVTEGPTLAAALRPVVAPGSAVTAGRIEALLASIHLVPAGTPFDATAHSAISPDGRWRLGVAQGAYTKARAEYVGAEQRAATRRRHIAELADRIAAAQDALAEEEARLNELSERLGALTTALRDLPRTRPLTDAWAHLAAAELAEDVLVQATARAATKAAEARAASVAARRQAEATATAHALPVDPALLDTVRDALRDLTAGTVRLRRDLLAAARTVTDHRAERDGFEEARTRRSAADSAYAGRRADLTEARREIRTLEETVGASEQQLLAAEDTIRRRLVAAADQLPRAEAKAADLHDERVRAEQDEHVRRSDLATQETAVIHRGRELRTALAAPEVLRGAGLADRTAELTTPDPAHDDARTRLKALRGLLDHLRGSLDPERRDISDTTLLNRFNDLRDQLAGGYDAALEEPDGVKVCRLVDDTGQHDVALVGERIAAQASEARARLTERERDVFQRFLTGELGDNLSSQVLAAGALVNALNDTLRSVRTSHGLGVELDWRLADTVDADVRAAVELLRGPSGLRTREQSEQLREVLQRRIEDARRADPAAGYAAHLRTALDYRSWFTFQPWVIDDSAAVRRRKFTGRTGLSQGEQRVLSYLVLFAAAAAHFTTLAESAPQAPRLILLDDAFAKVDEPTHARLGRILVDLDLDFVLTSERLMGNWPDVPSLHIYECLRDPHHRGVATLHYTWNGRSRRLVDV